MKRKATSKKKPISHRWIDQIEQIWCESKRLADQAEVLKGKSERLREQAIQLMRDTLPPSNPYTVVFGEEFVTVYTRPAA
jgi:hypothetical protein